MHIVLPIMVAIAASAAPAQARSDLEEGFVGSLRGCEEWILNPASWADGPESFVTAVRLGAKMALVNRVEDVNLPPKELRQGNHYWRINSTPSAGYVLVVSDTLPMCHITGGGDTDLQPVVTAVISSTEFKARWEELESNLKRGYGIHALP